MPDSCLLADVADAISRLQATFAAHGLGELRGIEVGADTHARLSSLRLSNIVELERPRLILDPEILGVPFRTSPR